MKRQKLEEEASRARPVLGRHGRRTHAATGASPLGTTRGARKEGGGGAPPSPLSRRVRVGIRGSFFALGSGQRPATAVGWHSCRSSRAPSSAAVWCVVGGPHDVLTSGGVGGAWTLDPAGERLQEARVEEMTRRLCPVAFWRQWNYWLMMVDAPGGLRWRRMELGGQIQRWRWCARAYRRWCNG
jgi:hypothetical protein